MGQVKPKRYAVTGAAGFIGSHLAEALLAAGHEVTGLDAFTDFYDPKLKERNARDLPVERRDVVSDTLDFSGLDGVFHLAGQGGTRAGKEAVPVYERLNVRASQRVAEAAAKVGVRLVFASSSSVYGNAARLPTPEETKPDPISPYGASKLAAEHAVRSCGQSFGFDVVVLRYFSVFGPRQRPDMAFARVASSLAHDQPFDLYGDGLQTRSWTYVSDVVEATIAAMEHGTGIYNVGGPVEASLRDAIGILEELAGKSLEVREHRSAAGDQRRTSADTTRIRSELGWTPELTLAEGLKAQWDWTTLE